MSTFLSLSVLIAIARASSDNFDLLQERKIGAEFHHGDVDTCAEVANKSAKRIGMKILELKGTQEQAEQVAADVGPNFLQECLASRAALARLPVGACGEGEDCGNLLVDSSAQPASGISFVTSFFAADPGEAAASHRDEILAALVTNLLNPVFVEINILYQPGGCVDLITEFKTAMLRLDALWLSGVLTSLNHSEDASGGVDRAVEQLLAHKLRCTDMAEQPTYIEMLQYANSVQRVGDVVVVGNADCAFDSTLGRLAALQIGQVMTLSVRGFPPATNLSAPWHVYGDLLGLGDRPDWVSPDEVVPRCMMRNMDGDAPRESWDIALFSTADRDSLLPKLRKTELNVRSMLPDEAWPKKYPSVDSFDAFVFRRPLKGVLRAGDFINLEPKMINSTFGKSIYMNEYGAEMAAGVALVAGGATKKLHNPCTHVNMFHLHRAPKTHKGGCERKPGIQCPDVQTIHGYSFPDVCAKNFTDCLEQGRDLVALAGSR